MKPAVARSPAATRVAPQQQALGLHTPLMKARPSPRVYLSSVTVSGALWMESAEGHSWRFQGAFWATRLVGGGAAFGNGTICG